MPRKLFTSFDIWEAHHKSNASDDLLALVIEKMIQDSYFLRKIPVDFQLAPEHVLSTIELLQPDWIICCGMAERRQVLTIESNGKYQNEVWETPLDLNSLIAGTIATQISHDAGGFVCNHLYYSVLKYIRETQRDCQCVFVHVPLLNAANLDAIVQDFLTIIQRIDAGKFLPNG